MHAKENDLILKVPKFKEAEIANSMDLHRIYSVSLQDFELSIDQIKSFLRFCICKFVVPLFFGIL